MIIYKNRFFKRITLSELNAEIKETVITKSESEKPHENYEVHIQRLLGVWKPLGSFNDLGSAISYAETFENHSFLKDDYQMIKVKNEKYIIIFVKNKYDEIRRIAKNRNMNMLRIIDIDNNICASFLESKEYYHKDINTAVDESDLVSFGNYLLSKEREKRLKGNSNTSIPYKERFRDVHDADLQNWKHIISNKN